MHKLQLTMLPGEYWYGGHTNYGYLMPVNAKKVMLVDTTVVRSYGQANTLFVSNKGRVIWSEAGFKTRFVFGRITCTGRKAKTACTRQTTTPCAALITMRWITLCRRTAPTRTS